MQFVFSLASKQSVHANKLTCHCLDFLKQIGERGLPGCHAYVHPALSRIFFLEEGHGI